MMRAKIANYQFEELSKEILFINKYDFDFKYLYEMNKYWKEFAFDLINEIYQACVTDPLIGISTKKDDLLIYIKNNYKMLIDKYRLKIDFKDYIELNDYVTLKEWLKEPFNNIEQNENGFFLIKE